MQQASNNESEAMEDMFKFADQLGPQKIVHIYEPRIGLKAIVVVDNTAAGPAIGGTRMAPDVSVEECFRLARAMTFKNAAAGLPHGGAKSVIFGDPLMPADQKERHVRAFAAAIRNIHEYIPGPDMGTNEVAMAWVKDEIGRSVGLPRELGGIPLDEIGATGFGLGCRRRSCPGVFQGPSSTAPASSCRASARSAAMPRASWRARAPRSSRPRTPKELIADPYGLNIEPVGGA